MFHSSGVQLGTLASVREPEHPRDLQALVLRVLPPGRGTVKHSQLEAPPLLPERSPLVPQGRRVRRGIGVLVGTVHDLR